MSFSDHNFCNASSVDDDGKYTKHRRKTPEPPADLLNAYLKAHSDKIRQVPTKSLYPNPNPNPNPIDVPKAQTPPKKVFQIPSLEEVQTYIADHKLTVNANRFHAYYTSNGWKVGRNPMKNWKAAIVTWQNKE